jgi:L-ascorbate metabolism protein UlaG (beta-lactamase superfamily)
MTEATSQTWISVRAIGGPTAALELGGLRFLTDPTFDAPGRYERPGGRFLTKTAGPALSPQQVGAVDAVLLSHDQHQDNLDVLGRDLVAQAPLVLTTPGGARRLGGTSRSLAPWQHMDLPRSGGGSLRVTGVPARHGPEGCEPVTGEVTGFVLSGEGLPSVYVSGDNASLDLVREIAGRLGPVEVAILFAGAARPGVLDGAYLTLTSDLAAQAARVLDAAHVVPVHFEGWQHFTEGAETLRTAFAEAGLADRLHLLDPGGSITFR